MDKNFLLVFILCLTQFLSTYSQEDKGEFASAYLHLKIGVIPSNYSWNYIPPTCPFDGPSNFPAQNWEPTDGVYKKSTSLELVFELARPLWSIQLNFGFKPSEIENNNSGEIYKFNSNYFSFGFLLFPLKRDQKIQPFLLAKAGMNFQSQNIEDNGEFYAYGAGTRYMFMKKWGVEFILEKLTTKYKMIPLGEGITDHFTVHPVKFSFGIVYLI